MIIVATSTKNTYFCRLMAYLQGAICDFHYARERPASLWHGTLQTRLAGKAWYPLYTRDLARSNTIHTEPRFGPRAARTTEEWEAGFPVSAI